MFPKFQQEPQFYQNILLQVAPHHANLNGPDVSLEYLHTFSLVDHVSAR